MQTIVIVASAVALFLFFGEVFYKMLTHGDSGVSPGWPLRVAFTVIGPLALVVIGGAHASLILLMLLAWFIVIYVGFPRAAVNRFVEKHHQQLTSDIPFYDTRNRPHSSAFTVLAVYWIVLAFFLYELA